MGTGLAPTALGIGVALAAAPGSVQAVLVAESLEGGVRRGSRALLGVHATFGLVMLGLAFGVAAFAPSATVLRILSAVGGLWLIWLAVDGVRSSAPDASANRRRLGPEIRGVLAIVLNPGAWVFVAVVASPLLATANERGGVTSATLVAIALVLGAALGDVALVLIAGLGVRRTGERAVRGVRLGLAVVLAGLGAWLLVRAW